MQQQIAVFIDFENLAIWADRQFYGRQWVGALVRFLSTRGRVVIKRAYADWNNFIHYRGELLEHSVDLIQLFQVNASKNRADIRLVIDALETALTNERIETFVIISGDSDFGPLINRLREHGRTTLGIGPAEISHQLLRKSCDEFIFLETVLGEVQEAGTRVTFPAAEVRRLLREALESLARQGALPVPLARLRAAMQGLDPAFNESSFDTPSFVAQVRINSDLARLEEGPTGLIVHQVATSAAQPRTLEEHYHDVLAGMGLGQATPGDRERVIADLFAELASDQRAANTPIEALERRYRETDQSALLAILRPLWQIAVQRQAARPANRHRGTDGHYGLAPGLDDAAFRRRVEAGLLDAIDQAGLPIDLPALANVLYGDPARADQVAALQTVELPSAPPSRAATPLAADMQELQREATLRVLWDDIREATSETTAHPLARARELVDSAREYRANDFARAAWVQLQACKLYVDAIDAGLPGATISTLRYYLGTYASLAAGDRATNKGRYEEARAYYRAFFFLLGTEDDPVWKQLRNLVSPMLQYYFYSVIRELHLTDEVRRLDPGWDFRVSSYADIAVRIATFPENPRLAMLWQALCKDLATVNPGLLRQVAAQIRREHSGQAAVASEMERLLPQE